MARRRDKRYMDGGEGGQCQLMEEYSHGQRKVAINCGADQLAYMVVAQNK